MVAGKFFIGSRIDPNCVVVPGSRLIDCDQFGGRDRRLPRNAIAKINAFDDRRDEREGDKEQGLSNRAGLHRLLRYGDRGRRPASVLSFHLNSARVGTKQSQ